MKFALYNKTSDLLRFEREIIRGRTLAGLESAKARGKKGGRKHGLSKDSLRKAATVKTLYNSGHDMNSIAVTLKISRASGYRYLELLKEKEEKEKVA